MKVKQTIKQKAETTLVLKYSAPLVTFLDKKRIYWSAGGRKIYIFFRKYMSAEELFQFAMEYRDFLDTTN